MLYLLDAPPDILSVPGQGGPTPNTCPSSVSGLFHPPDLNYAVLPSTLHAMGFAQRGKESLFVLCNHHLTVAKSPWAVSEGNSPR